VSERDLQGRAAWVTGGATGMGRACALALAKAGADVAIGSLTGAVANRQVKGEAALVLGEDELATTRGEIEALGVRALAMPLNVCSNDSVAGFFKETVGAFGKIDILINAAGGSAHHMMVDHPDELWHRTIDVNLTGPYRTIKLCLPGMIERKCPGHAAMCSSKTGLLGLTRCVALEGAPHGVTCNAINPGSVRSPHVVRVAIPNKLKMLGIDQKVDDYLAHIPDDTPQKRWIEAEEIGAFAAFLCREEALGLTMEDVQISGGASW
jgi:NAD(P)-dependent dehydrogenase (short-subunit alcohol dehydrogenase family)